MRVSFKFVLCGAALLAAAGWSISNARAQKESGDGSAASAIRDVTEFPRFGQRQHVQDALARPLILKAVDQPLSKVMQSIADSHGVNIMIDESAIPGGDATKIQVSIDATAEKTLAAALERLLDDVGIDYYAEYSCLNITSQEKARRHHEIRAYDVRPLLLGGVTAADVAEAISSFLPQGSVRPHAQGHLVVVSHNRRVHAEIYGKLNRLTPEDCKVSDPNRN